MPFVLFWANISKCLAYKDIQEIDSIKTDEFLHLKTNDRKSIFDPVALHFEDRDESKFSEPVDTQTKYMLYAYLNNTRYYLARRSTRLNSNGVLVLTSNKNNDLIKGRI